MAGKSQALRSWRARTPTHAPGCWPYFTVTPPSGRPQRWRRLSHPTCNIKHPRYERDVKWDMNPIRPSATAFNHFLASMGSPDVRLKLLSPERFIIILLRWHFYVTQDSWLLAQERLFHLRCWHVVGLDRLLLGTCNQVRAYHVAAGDLQETTTCANGHSVYWPETRCPRRACGAKWLTAPRRQGRFVLGKHM